MITLKPFKALRPTSESASHVASLPYDVVSREEASQIIKDNPKTFMRIIRSDADLDSGIDAYSDEAYHKAVANLKEFQENNLLVQEEEESFYVYEIKEGSHSQTGIIALSAVQDYKNSKIKIHEKTRPEKLEDRTRHMHELKAHTGPVLMTFRAREEIDKLLAEDKKSDPIFSLTAARGVKHTVWKMSENSQIAAEFKNVPATYIADGHHRAESSKVCADKLNQEHGAGEHDYFLTVLFPDNQLKILSYNRIVKSFPEGQSAEQSLEKIAEVMKIKESNQKEPLKKGEFCMYMDGKWSTLTPKTLPDSGDAVLSLDCSILQNAILAPVFSIEDPRVSNNVAFVGGIRGTDELEKLVDSGKAICAFSLYPVSTEDLLSVADSGQTMPPKSTWFEPKLSSGLATHLF